jgi:hypothetical protein
MVHRVRGPRDAGASSTSLRQRLSACRAGRHRRFARFWSCSILTVRCSRAVPVRVLARERA